MKFKSKDQLIKFLKNKATRIQRKCERAYDVLSSANQSRAYPCVEWRTHFGPYKVRAGVFESRKFWFDPIALKATSYRWWSMLTFINGKLVRNQCPYSISTSRHQEIMSSILDALHIKPDLIVNVRSNIGDAFCRSDWQNEMLYQYGKLSVQLNHCRSNNKKGYRERLTGHLKLMREVEKLKCGVRFSKKAMKEAVTSAEENRKKTFGWEANQKRQAQTHPRDSEVNRWHANRIQLTAINGGVQ